jgi:hypothetical protein
MSKIEEFINSRNERKKKGRDENRERNEKIKKIGK